MASYWIVLGCIFIERKLYPPEVPEDCIESAREFLMAPLFVLSLVVTAPIALATLIVVEWKNYKLIRRLERERMGE